MELKEFGLYFAKLREKSGYTSQRQLAQKSGISNGTIARIESGTQRATPETLVTLAKHLEGNPYLEFLSKLGYVDIKDSLNQEYLLRLEKYKGLIIALHIAYRFLQGEGTNELLIEVLDDMVNAAKKVNVEINLNDFTSNSEETIQKIMKSINFEDIDVINSSNIHYTDRFQEINKIIDSKFSAEKELELLQAEKKKLQEELELEFLDTFNNNYFNSELSQEENELVNELIKKAMISKRTGKNNLFLNMYLNSFDNDDKYKKSNEKNLNVIDQAFQNDIKNETAQKIHFFESLESDLGLDLTDPEVQKKLKRAAKIIFSDED
ncbi:helix-turn-helix domain-containing protein [Paenibacillus pini]|uniref:HTH cro/C1-type domain-containing protein n=1 Tax=Paenibacillus pini JCM 16418 TaxID=1236976 RepID=W7YGR6_9BACL|nr:helix-turn-helix transcriptional regulator [Paenibacillus pini]GAF06788.1 hypothetical protein JCM16418_770 [Paenibacillus pini JCM 16418]